MSRKRRQTRRPPSRTGCSYSTKRLPGTSDSASAWWSRVRVSRGAPSISTLPPRATSRASGLPGPCGSSHGWSAVSSAAAAPSAATLTSGWRLRRAPGHRRKASGSRPLSWSASLSTGSYTKGSDRTASCQGRGQSEKSYGRASFHPQVTIRVPRSPTASRSAPTRVGGPPTTYPRADIRVWNITVSPSVRPSARRSPTRRSRVTGPSERASKAARSGRGWSMQATLPPARAAWRALGTARIRALSGAAPFTETPQAPGTTSRDPAVLTPEPPCGHSGCRAEHARCPRSSMIVHGSTGPGNSRPGRTVPPSPRGARSALRNCAKGVLVLTLALGATTACGPFSDSGSGSSKNRDGSSDGGSRQSEDWKAGDCAGPDTSRSKDGFQALDCDDPKATIKALEVKDGEIFAGAVECPAGTDEIISVKVSFGGDASAGLPSKTICGRNLSDDHPGDAGAGGGQLVVGDCVD